MRNEFLISITVCCPLSAARRHSSLYLEIKKEHLDTDSKHKHHSRIPIRNRPVPMVLGDARDKECQIIQMKPASTGPVRTERPNLSGGNDGLWPRLFQINNFPLQHRRPSVCSSVCLFMKTMSVRVIRWKVCASNGRGGRCASEERRESDKDGQREERKGRGADIKATHNKETTPPRHGRLHFMFLNNSGGVRGLPGEDTGPPARCAG